MAEKKTNFFHVFRGVNSSKFSTTKSIFCEVSQKLEILGYFLYMYAYLFLCSFFSYLITVETIFDLNGN